MVYCTHISLGKLIEVAQQSATGDHRAMDWDCHVDVLFCREFDQLVSPPLDVQRLSHSRSSGRHHSHT